MKSADVGARVLPGDILDDEHPVVASLLDDGVSGVSTEGEVTHCQQVQRPGLSDH